MKRAPSKRLAAALLLLVAAAAGAQLSTRPEDPLGLSIRERRVQVIHSDTPEVPGTSMHLQQSDPWLAYQRGRSYFFREFGPEDGAFHSLPPRPEAASSTSCGMCHNLPFPSPGAGGDVAIPVGTGRNAPHLFGAGLLETVALQIRAQVLAAYDTNRNGWLDVPAETEGKRVTVEASPGVQLDFGSLADGDGDGRPDLNPAFIVRMVDAAGKRWQLNKERKVVRLGDPGIVGYDLAIGIFATSAGDHQFPSMRSFSIGVFNTINGLLIDAPAVPAPEIGGWWLPTWGQISNAGSFNSEVFLTGDPAKVAEPGVRGRIGVGEVDLLEWFLVNHPSPAVAPQDERTQRGRVLLDRLGCTSCHVDKWTIQPADERTGLPGDRRFFDLQVAHNAAAGRLEGRLRPLTREVAGPGGGKLLVPRREGFSVENAFTDLRHHDVGERFYEYDYRRGKLYVIKRFRTSPLWGVGSSAPYGHDGLSLSLDDVIRRHGGEAAEATKAYVAATPQEREDLQAFLRSLILYQPEMLPTDLDGDGRIAAEHTVAGLPAGPERFWPELLFQVPPRYKGWIEGPDGDRYFSFALLNVAEAYGERLQALVDADADGVPDMAGARPVAAGR